MSLPFRGSKRPLNLLIDTTSIKAEGEDKWNARSIPLTHASMSCRAVGGPNRRIWRKIHIGIDEEILEVRAVEVTTNNIGDAPMLPELLNQIPPGQVVGCGFCRKVSYCINVCRRWTGNPPEKWLC
jgi:hypothetical protein